MATYWVQTYSQLFMARVLTGVSIGGATPVIFSLLADLYSEEQRIFVSMMIGVAMGSGMAAGQLIAGLVGPALGWRVPFLIVSIPALLCGIAVGVYLEEPHRGSMEHAVRTFHDHAFAVSASAITIKDKLDCRNPTTGAVDFKHSRQIKSHELTVTVQDESKDVTTLSDMDASACSAAIPQPPHYNEKIDCSKVGQMFTTKSVSLILLQGLPGCLPWGMLYVFMNDFLSEEKEMSVQHATAVMTCFSVGGLLGQVRTSYQHFR